MSPRSAVPVCIAALAIAGCGANSQRQATSTPSAPGATTTTTSHTRSLPPLSADVQSRIRQVVQGAMSAGGYPGMVVGIWTPGARGFVDAFGQADTSTGAPLSTNDWLRVGSITKTFTATVVLQLVQRGELRLTDKLSQFEPQVPNASSITIRELLNHTSGLPGLPAGISDQITANPEMSWPSAQVIAAAAAQPALSPPGASYNYANTNYLILGEIASQVTHTDVGTLIQRHVLAPLGLRHTTYAPGAAFPSPRAHGYVNLGGQQVDTTAWNCSWAGAAGCMASTVGDLHVYARALATGEGLVSSATQQQRLQFVQTNIPGLSYGLGIYRIGSFLGHDGEVPGYDSIMLYSPVQRATLIVLGTTSPDFDSLSPTSSVTALQVAQMIYPVIFPGQSLGVAGAG